MTEVKQIEMMRNRKG